MASEAVTQCGHGNKSQAKTSWTCGLTAIDRFACIAVRRRLRDGPEYSMGGCDLHHVPIGNGGSQLYVWSGRPRRTPGFPQLRAGDVRLDDGASSSEG